MHSVSGREECNDNELSQVIKCLMIELASCRAKYAEAVSCEDRDIAASDIDDIKALILEKLRENHRRGKIASKKRLRSGISQPVPLEDAFPVSEELIKSAESSAHWSIIDHTPFIGDTFQIKETCLELPKGTSAGDTLLWTGQAHSLLNDVTSRKGQSGVVKNGFILVAPNGIGGSSIALSVALGLFAVANPVLYISDAGNLIDFAFVKLDEGSSLSVLHDIILPRLMQMFLQQNPLCKPRLEKWWSQFIGTHHRRPTQRDFLLLLNELNTVVVIDGHGRAYSKINERMGDLAGSHFPFLMPNCYQGCGAMYLRFLLVTSEHCRFLGRINSTYSLCVCYLQPFDLTDATNFRCLLNADSTRHHISAEDSTRLCNNVPGEMVLYHSLGDEYLSHRVQTVTKILRLALSIAESSPVQVMTLYDYLSSFEERSGSVPGIASMYMGFCYWTGSEQKSLCYAVTKSLLNLREPKAVGSSKVDSK